MQLKSTGHSAIEYLNFLKYTILMKRLNRYNTPVAYMTNKYIVLLERDENGWIVAKVPDLPGCYTQAKTVEEAMVRIKEAIQLCVETEKHKPVKNQFIGVQQLEV